MSPNEQLPNTKQVIAQLPDKDLKNLARAFRMRADEHEVLGPLLGALAEDLEAWRSALRAQQLLEGMGVPAEIAAEAVIRWADYQTDPIEDVLGQAIVDGTLKAVCAGCGSFWTGRKPSWVGQQDTCPGCASQLEG
jgi:hypothetical protein